MSDKCKVCGKLLDIVFYNGDNPYCTCEKKEGKEEPKVYNSKGIDKEKRKAPLQNFFGI